MSEILRYNLEDIPSIMVVEVGLDREGCILIRTEALKLFSCTNVVGAVRCDGRHDCAFQHHWCKSSASRVCAHEPMRSKGTEVVMLPPRHLCSDMFAEG